MKVEIVLQADFILGESPSPRKTPMIYRLSGHSMAGQEEVTLQLLGFLQLGSSH